MDVLTPQQVEEALGDLDGWAVQGSALVKTFRFHDFAAAVDFVNAVAELAEGSRHHPDIDVRFNKVTLSVMSHEAGGVTAQDLDLARLIDCHAR